MQETRSEFTVESEDIHAKMYELATASNGTAIQRDPIGGSENFPFQRLWMDVWNGDGSVQLSRNTLICLLTENPTSGILNR